VAATCRIRHAHTQSEIAIKFHAPVAFGKDSYPASFYPHQRSQQWGQTRAFRIARSLLDGKVFDNAFFNLFKAVVSSSSSNFLCISNRSFFGARFSTPHGIDKIQSSSCAHFNRGFRRD